ncbi:MBL fold metallo-hydrolase [Desertibaculum subflavum]|uniref:MBL fold metallo-hydrolase n=1 Tax=Desertibaculum subflavum TaxID=2268458 RepID=UPI000E661431
MAERPHHHTGKGYRNPPGSPARKHDRREYWSFIWRRIVSRQAAPIVPLDHALDGEAVLQGIAAAGARDSVTWLGHAAFLLRLDGRTVLLDPYLGEFAGPMSRGPRRFVPPALAVEQLPPIDLVLVSHNHYDHLCEPTVRALARRHPSVVMVPLGLGKFFRRRGFGDVRELDWEQASEAGGLTVTALPAIHWSKRTPFDRNRSLWASFAVAGARRRIWFAGDTAAGPVFEEIGRRHGPFDAALVPIGAYEPRSIMEAHHANPEEAVAIGRAMRADRLIAMHWGTVVLTDEDPFEPPDRFRRAALAAGLAPEQALVPRIGETIALDDGWPSNRP